MEILVGYWNFYASDEQSTRLLLIRQASAPAEKQRHQPLKSLLPTASSSGHSTD